MGYYNPLLAYGLDAFSADAAAAGVDGLIVGGPAARGVSRRLHAACRPTTFDLIYLARTNQHRRAHRAGGATLASGFIYCVSVTGVTGARDDTISPGWRSSSTACANPHRLAFGGGIWYISALSTFEAVAPIADAAVIGSAIIDEIDKIAVRQNRRRG